MTSNLLYVEEGERAGLVSKSFERVQQKGFTLLEMLVVLAVLMLATSAATVGITKLSPSLAVKSASYQLLSDLKMARVTAMLKGAAVSVMFSEGGYDVKAIQVERAWPAGVSAVVDGPIENEILFSESTRLASFTVTLSKGKTHERIEIAPATHRIARAIQ